MTTATESKNPKIPLEQPNQDSPLDHIHMTTAGDSPLVEPAVSSPLTLADETASEGKQATESKLNTDSAADKGEAPATDVQKKIRRAERFGVPVHLSEQEKRNTRAERFGTASTIAEPVKNSEDQKRKSRAERFGTSVPASADDEAKKKARLARFAAAPNTTSATTTTSASATTTAEEEKRNARAIRFSQPTGSITQVNGEGDIKGKTAIAKVGNGT